MATNHYVNHNRRMLQATISKEQHLLWVKEREARALKRAKATPSKTQGKVFTSFYDLRRYLKGWDKPKRMV